MPIKKANKINLLPQDDFSSSTFGRILKWVLSSFRIMVIITELVVMGAFLSRFWLDARNSDLNETIGVQKAQVQAYSSVERNFRNYQKKLAIVSTLYSEPLYNEFVKNITTSLPVDVRLTSVQITSSGFQIKATSFSEESVANLLSNLEENKQLQNIKLTQVSSSIDDTTTLIFTISGEYKNQIAKGENK